MSQDFDKVGPAEIWSVSPDQLDIMEISTSSFLSSRSKTVDYGMHPGRVV